MFCRAKEIMLNYLIIIYIFNLWLSYRLFKRLIAPPFLFGVGFLAMAVVASFYQEEWSLDLRDDTFAILSLGVLWFTVVCGISDRVLKIKERKRIRGGGERLSFNRIRVGRLKRVLFIFILMSIVASYLKIAYLKSHYGNLGDLSLVIRSYNLDMRADEIDFVFPLYIRIIGRLTFALAFFSGYCLCLQRVLKYKDRKLSLLLWCHILTAGFYVMLTGQRGKFVTILIVTAIMFFLKLIGYYGRIVVSRKFVIAGVIVLSLTPSMFYSLANLLGRQTTSGSSYAFAVYCGAQIKNLDIYMSNPSHSRLWGRETFFVLYRQLGYEDKKYFNNLLTNPYNSVNGHNLGNVYTTFYQFYMDFRVAGVVILTALMAVISTFFYKKALGGGRSFLDLNIYVPCYGYLGDSLLFSFFSDKFYENIIDMLKVCVILYVLGYLYRKYLLKAAPVS